MPDGVKITTKNVMTVYKLAVEDWTNKAGGLIAISGSLKTAATISKMLPFVEVILGGIADIALEKRLKAIEEQTASLRRMIEDLFKAIKNLEEQIVVVANEGKQHRLDTIANQVNMIVQKARLPGTTASQFVEYCIELQVLADNFLQEPPKDEQAGEGTSKAKTMPSDLWRTAAIDLTMNPPTVLRGQFSTWPTLLLYATIITTWTRLREAAQRGGRALPDENNVAIAMHLEALSVHDGFDRHAKIDPKKPYTLLEYAILHVRPTFSAASHGLECVLTEHVYDHMSHQSYSQESGRTQLAAGAICSLDTFHIGAEDLPRILYSIEELAGIGLVRSLADRLAPSAPMFAATPSLSDTTLYVCYEDGNLEWQRMKVKDGIRPSIAERKPIGNGWDMFRKVVPNGQFALYGLKPDGSLHWYWHEGHDKGKFAWKGPIEQRTFNTYRELFGSSDGVFYAVDANGNIDWYRHDGFEAGAANAWRGPIRMPPVADWSNAVSVFGLGRGRLYVLRADGTLTWHHHPGYLDGKADLSEGKPVGKNWDRYRFAFADRPEHIFALHQNGSLHVFRHFGADDGSGVSDASRIRLPGGLVIIDRIPPNAGPKWLQIMKDDVDQPGPAQAPVPHPRKWEGPITVETDLRQVAYAFALAHVQPAGPR